ncbi:MAG: hypothetical protein JSV88_31245 [Candidatus Aminicenantes bacterium]|nr:MAG: hypothetical protein JSV88_31245 [Candidatus Aminicenantes bacterium]
MKKILVILFLIVLLVVTALTSFKADCDSSAAIAAEEESSLYMDCFEIVWRTVNQKHFDPTFGGVDWKGVYKRYKPLISAVTGRREFYLLINKMLFQLNVSHLGVVPPDVVQRLEPVVFAEGSIGLDVRWCCGDAVINRVTPGSPAHIAGLRPSFLIKTIDGTPIEKIAEERLSLLEPPYNKRASITNEILGRIYGPAGTKVTIAYLDDRQKNLQKTITRKQRDGKAHLADIFPVSFTQFEAKRLEQGIGYIRFNCFHPVLNQKLVTAIRSMHDASGLIIDLRGNPGGSPLVGKVLAEQLVGTRRLFYKMHFRCKTVDIYLEPGADVYKGPVAVLIDVTTKSAAELFAVAIQAIGRGKIVGERSAGTTLGADGMKLPNGALLLYPVFQTTPANGKKTEGIGVEPDIPVRLDYAALLTGRDSQLEAAVHFLTHQQRVSLK